MCHQCDIHFVIKKGIFCDKINVQGNVTVARAESIKAPIRKCVLLSRAKAAKVAHENNKNIPRIEDHLSCNVVWSGDSLHIEYRAQDDIYKWIIIVALLMHTIAYQGLSCQESDFHLNICNWLGTFMRIIHTKIKLLYHFSDTNIIQINFFWFQI